MKKLLLLLVAFLPAFLFGQIKIGETVYATLNEAGDAATENGDTITVAGVVEHASVYGFKKDNLVIMGVTADAQIKMATDARLGFEEGKTITVENLTIAGTQLAERMIWVSGATHLILKNDTIRDAHNTSGHGGAFLLADQSLTEAYNCVFKNNKALQNGGVFWIVNEADLKVSNTLFTENVSQFEGGDGKGGVMAWVDQNHEILVENSAFINNWSVGHSGVFQAESNLGTTAKFINCTFSGNHSGGQGGVVWYLGAGEDLTFINCTAIDNASGGEGNGGFISLWDQVNTPVAIYNSIINNNGYKDPEGNFVPSLSVTSNVARGIDINNSFVNSGAVDPVNVTISGSGNIDGTAGETYLENPDFEGGIYYYSYAVETSVLNALGDPEYLADYSTTDQRGWIRKMNETTISAGSFDLSAEPYDSVVLVRTIDPVTLISTLSVSYDGVFEVYQIPSTDILGEVEYDVESSDDAKVTAELNTDTKEIELTRISGDEGDVITITLTGYSAKTAYNTTSFDVTLGRPSAISGPAVEQGFVYPNPAYDYIMLSAGSTEGMVVTIYCVNGEVIESKILDKSTSKINISSLTEGMYFIKAVDNNGVNYRFSFIKK